MAAPQRPKPRPSFRPSLESLEERYCPSTTWNPQLSGGVYSTDGNNAANYTNGLPAKGNPLILDGSKTSYNQPITFSKALDIIGLTVQNNYNNTLTINKGATLSTENNNTVNTGCTLTIVSADSKGIYIDLSGVTFRVESGATLKLTDPVGATTGGTFLTAQLNDAGEYLGNLGTVTWNGTGVAKNGTPITDTIQAGIVSTGTFNADGGTKGDNTRVGGILDVSGRDTSTNNVGFYMISGSLNLTNRATLNAAYNYYQAAGSLISDSSPVTLKAFGSAAGDINIAGGNVVVDNVANTVAEFNFSASTVEMNGELDVNGLMTGGNSMQSDRLNCGSSTVTFGTNSYLNVGTTGTQLLGKNNNWTVMQYGTKKNSWGKPPKVPAGMTANTTANAVVVTGPT